MTVVSTWHSSHFRPPGVLSCVTCLGLWNEGDGVAEDEACEEEAEEAGVLVVELVAESRSEGTGTPAISFEMSISKNALRVKAPFFFALAVISCRMNAFSTAMSKA